MIRGDHLKYGANTYWGVCQCVRTIDHQKNKMVSRSLHRAHNGESISSSKLFWMQPYAKDEVRVLDAWRSFSAGTFLSLAIHSWHSGQNSKFLETQPDHWFMQIIISMQGKTFFEGKKLHRIGHHNLMRHSQSKCCLCSCSLAQKRLRFAILISKVTDTYRLY